jgi:hypothetical protein
MEKHQNIDAHHVQNHITAILWKNVAMTIKMIKQTNHNDDHIDMYECKNF